MAQSTSVITCVEVFSFFQNFQNLGIIMTADASKISSNVLDMKFMRRTKQRLEEKEKKKQETNLQKAYLAGQTDKLIGSSSSTSRFVFTKDLEFLEDLQYGRMSFRGCNPQVEVRSISILLIFQ